jgi:hypothetical protein
MGTSRASRVRRRGDAAGADTDTTYDVSGLLTWENGGPVEGASAPALLKARFSVTLPGMPTVTGVRWSPTLSEPADVDLAEARLPNPQWAKLAIDDGAATNTDGSVRVSGIPAGVAPVFGRLYDPGQDRASFPGRFEDADGSPLNQTVFLWGAALDDAGAPANVGYGASARLLVPVSQRMDLVDQTPGNGAIEVPMCDFDETSGTWESYADGAIVTDSSGGTERSKTSPAITSTSYGSRAAISVTWPGTNAWSSMRTCSGLPCTSEGSQAPPASYLRGARLRRVLSSPARQKQDQGHHHCEQHARCRSSASE